MEELFACPFCRQLFRKGEVNACPECEIKIQPLKELPPSHDAALLDPPEEPTPPEFERLPWTYLGRGRGVLLLLSVVGIACFFTPWLNESAPEIRVWSGLDFARKLGWLWGAPVAWFVMIPLVASRRTIHHMRGSRVILACLAAVALLTALMRLLFQPAPSPLVPSRFEYGWGLYVTALLALVTLGFTLRFGGTLRDMPTRAARRGDETLH